LGDGESAGVAHFKQTLCAVIPHPCHDHADRVRTGRSCD
jgi:hypothetical protein